MNAETKAPRSKRQAPEKLQASSSRGAAARVIEANGNLGGFMLLKGVPAGCCEKCAYPHDLEQPHNQQTMYWQYWFREQNGRWPAWADAMSHCPAAVQAHWRRELTAMGVDVDAAASTPERACRVCGCTEQDCRQCVEASGEPCHWVAADLCSSCAGAALPGLPDEEIISEEIRSARAWDPDKHGPAGTGTDA